MTFKDVLLEFLEEHMIARRRFPITAGVGRDEFNRWLKGHFPGKDYWGRVIEAGIVKDEAELLALKPAPKPRNKATEVYPCPHCGCLIRKRTGKALDENLRGRMPVAENLRTISVMPTK